LVVGRRVAGAFFAIGFWAVALALAWVRDLATGAFLLAAGVLPGVAVAPDATRDECFARCLVFFGAAAASAIDDSANVAMRATMSIFSVLRTMRTSSEASGWNGSGYDNTADR
jgi:hypothetical protein